MDERRKNEERNRQPRRIKGREEGKRRRKENKERKRLVKRKGGERETL